MAPVEDDPRDGRGRVVNVLPPEELLPSAPYQKEDQAEAERTGHLLTEKLDQLGSRCEIEKIIIGPQITRYELVPYEGLSVRKLPLHAADLAYEIAAETVRIIAPIPGKRAVGIEVPTPTRKVVLLRDVLHVAKTPTTFALGLDADGNAIACDIAKQPHMLVAGMTGAGKALAIDTPIPTPEGWTAMGDLRYGDEVFDEKGNVCHVSRAYEIKHNRPCFNIKFSDGSSLIADADHQWTTWTEKARRSEYMASRKKNPSSPYSNDQSHKRHRPSVVTTKQISESMIGRQGKINHSIPVAKPLEIMGGFSMPIDPYLLGAWLGDGTSATGQITTADQAIIFEFIERGYSIKTGSTRYRYTIDTLSKSLREMSLIGNKHIPANYLRAPFRDRLDLLQGLMDTDGHASKSGSCSSVSIDRQLADNTYELICSLGIKASITTKRAMYQGKDCGEAFTITFTPSIPVFKLDRKLKRQTMGAKKFINDHRYIVSVEPVESVPVRCIEVTSENHLYLAGKSFIPTHNSTMIHAMLCSLLMRATPNELGLILIDPKMVEFTFYNGIPHLMMPVVTDAKEAAHTLDWLVQEMEARYAFCEHAGVRELSELNATLPDADKFPYLICVVDELADLMMVARKEVEASVIRIAQKARAVGIHLVLATQTPRVAVVTGLIKSNMPARIAFTTAQALDSRVILDRNGAETLLNDGDGLYMAGDSGSPVRFQSAYVDTEQVEGVCDWWRCQPQREHPTEELVAA